MPDLDPVGENQPTQRDRECDLCNLCCNQNFSLIKSIGRGTSDHGERESRKAGREIGHPQENRLVRQRTHDPSLGHDLHPGAGVGNRRADDVPAESARPQKRQRSMSDPFFFRAHRQDS